jgi:hypothetical protein
MQINDVNKIKYIIILFIYCYTFYKFTNLQIYNE